MNDLLKNAKPIIFNTEMVKAILEGRKTQFRKVIKYGLYLYDVMNENCIEVAKNYCDMDEHNFPELKNEMIKHSKYKVGDILYVKETFNLNGEEWGVANPIKINYLADNINSKIKWFPSAWMRKEYARIFLKVTNVKVERLQDISYEDLKNEMDFRHFEEGEIFRETQYDEFIKKWNSQLKYSKGIRKSQNNLNKYKWEDNPYVFVYEFERIK